MSCKDIQTIYNIIYNNEEAEMEAQYDQGFNKNRTVYREEYVPFVASGQRLRNKDH